MFCEGTRGGYTVSSPKSRLSIITEEPWIIKNSPGDPSNLRSPHETLAGVEPLDVSKAGRVPFQTFVLPHLYRDQDESYLNTSAGITDWGTRLF
jgi:hypothetical protein